MNSCIGANGAALCWLAPVPTLQTPQLRAAQPRAPATGAVAIDVRPLNAVVRDGQWIYAACLSARRG
eukprot:363419-Chlamydomonas_euryale.AAC.13